jgi:hypothetical protein
MSSISGCKPSQAFEIVIMVRIDPFEMEMVVTLILSCLGPSLHLSQEIDQVSNLWFYLIGVMI